MQQAVWSGVLSAAILLETCWTCHWQLLVNPTCSSLIQADIMLSVKIPELRRIANIISMPLQIKLS